MRQYDKGGLTMRTLLRGMLPLLLFAALLPAVASAQVPGVGGYAGPGPETTGDTGNGPGTDPGNGAGSPGTAPSSAGAAASKGTLPFTGMQLAFMTAAGLGVIGLGVALRRASRPRLTGGT